MRPRSWLWIIISTLLTIMFACSFLSLPTPSPEVTYIAMPYLSNNPYEILKITPRPDNRLCWDPQAEGYLGGSWEDQKANVPVTSGMGGGMGEGDIADSILKGWSTFEVNPDVPLTGTFHWLYPQTPQNTLPVPTRFIVILDEQQLSGAIEGTSGPYYDVTLQPGDEITLTLKLPPLAPGVHDLVVLNLIQQEPDPNKTVKAAPNRYTLLAGSTPEIIPRTFQPLQKQGSLAKDDPHILLELSLTGEYPFTVWNWPEPYLPVSVSEKLSFFIFTAYTSSIFDINTAAHPATPEEVPFALLTLLDGEQIDFAPEIPVFYGSVSKDTAYTAIPASLGPFDEAGQHELLVLRINYPGLPMCLLHGPSDGYGFDHFLRAQRVGIEVIQEP